MVLEVWLVGIYRKIKELLTAGRAVALVTMISNSDDQAAVGRILVSDVEEHFYNRIDKALADQVRDQVQVCLKKGQSAFFKLNSAQEKTAQVFIHTFNPPPRLIIMGGGHVGAALCRIASHLDYTIVLIDDRPSFASEASHPQAHRIICDKFDRALEELKASPTDYIVIVTRGHQHDRLCLEKALESEAVYIGMIGSRRRVSAQLRNLAETGYTEEQLSRIHSPIGLSIGAVTESEIAISILAEITKVRRGISRDEAAQNEIIEAISMLEENGEQAVLATIISTQGSTPRKAGSQMIVYPDGSLKGTVGGGCSEAEVRREALLCLDQGQSNRFRLNLTADAAAEEGMACGGTMDIYLEMLPLITPEIFS
jgi:xanthine dehydrogenase accessory factor